MAPQFTKATKRQAKLRMAIDGPSGSGKTYTALVAAMALKNGGRVAVIDTERGSAAKYADLFDFDTLDMMDSYPKETFDPANYIEAIRAAEAAGYDVLIIDSLSHAWEGEGGVLEKHDNETRRMGNNQSFQAWKNVTPQHNRLVTAMLNCGCHLIVTMRSKMDHIITTNDKGQTIIKKVGMAPIQRNGIEYEFDLVADMDIEHSFVVSKSRCFAMADKVASKPAGEFFAPLKAWLSDGAPQPEREPEPERVPAKVGPNGERIEPSWTSTPGQLEKMAQHYGLSYDTILAALDVAKLEDYQGSKKDAASAIDAFIRDEMEKGEPEPSQLTM